MKKYFIIAAAAIVAMAACTKVETVGTPDQKVTFQAANYTTQTKAGEVSVLSDFDAFKCRAFLHAEGIDLNADGTVKTTSYQEFFGSAGETISWNSTNKEWAPSHVYYWPKGTKSFVNFVGWYGTDGTNAVDPTVTYAYDGTASKWTASMTWTFSNTSVGEAGTNLLYADMAWHFKSNNNPATYGKDGVTEGVPMLFHHALAQINVKAYADGTSLSAGTGTVSDANATWAISLENVQINPIYTAGTLALTNADPGSKTTQAWTGSWTGTGTAGALTASDYLVDDITKANAGDLIAATCVLPQTLGATVKLTFDMRITTTYNTNPTNPNVELIPVEITLNDMGTSAWALNTKYTYYIKIIPSQNKVLFDPALEAEWIEVEGTEQTI